MRGEGILKDRVMIEAGQPLSSVTSPLPHTLPSLPSLSLPTHPSLTSSPLPFLTTLHYTYPHSIIHSISLCRPTLVNSSMGTYPSQSTLVVGMCEPEGCVQEGRWGLGGVCVSACMGKGEGVCVSVVRGEGEEV